jgi:predicted metal-dependent phosphoesterase TrpH
LGITDHDTFAGYDRAVPLAVQAGIKLVCGIELSTKLNGQSVHLLGYFLRQDQLAGFRTWILEMQASRRDRNTRLVARLRDIGIDITLEEAEARGRGITGRPHFARILLEKGYVKTVQQAFDDYLADSARGYVDRREPTFREGVERIRGAGGIASIAHPVRLEGGLAPVIDDLCKEGMNGIEAYHSDHKPEDTEQFLSFAAHYDLVITGGSDYHGLFKPGIELGTGRNGNVHVPETVWGILAAQR